MKKKFCVRLLRDDGFRAASAHVCRRSENELSTVGGGSVFQTDGSGCSSRPDCYLPAVRPRARRSHDYELRLSTVLRLSPDQDGCHRIMVITEFWLAMIRHNNVVDMITQFFLSYDIRRPLLNFTALLHRRLCSH